MHTQPVAHLPYTERAGDIERPGYGARREEGVERVGLREHRQRLEAVDVRRGVGEDGGVEGGVGFAEAARDEALGLGEGGFVAFAVGYADLQAKFNEDKKVALTGLTTPARSL